MYLMYVDESGDTGLINSPTSYFVLSGLAVHESDWRDFTDRLIAFRKTMKTVYGLPIRTEIHASEYLRSPPVPGMSRNVRLSILRNYLDEIAKISYVAVTNVIVDKSTKAAPYDIFNNAWQALFQRFENTLRNGNFPGNHPNSSGIVFVDNTDGKKLTSLMRRMGAFNPIPNTQALFGSGYRNIPLIQVIEDPSLRDSKSSYMIQTMDVCAFFLHQRFKPNKFVRKSNAVKYFDRLKPVLNLRASRFHTLGVVQL